MITKIVGPTRITDFPKLFRLPTQPELRMLVRGKVCGVEVSEIAYPLMREVRILDKLVDELAKGRPLERVLNRG